MIENRSDRSAWPIRCEVHHGFTAPLQDRYRGGVGYRGQVHNRWSAAASSRARSTSFSTAWSTSGRPCTRALPGRASTRSSSMADSRRAFHSRSSCGTCQWSGRNKKLAGVLGAATRLTKPTRTSSTTANLSRQIRGPTMSRRWALST